MNSTLFTIGHSNHTIEHFIDLLREHEVQAVADVRSVPYSGFAPQFSREAIRASLEAHSIKYVFLGEELGGRSDNPACYDGEGRVQYDVLKRETTFKEGMQRVFDGLKKYRVALMCTEKDPMDCHRAIHIALSFIREYGLDIAHIRADGSLESHEELEDRLRRLYKRKLPSEDMLSSQDEIVNRAYELREKEVAYINKRMRTDKAENRTDSGRRRAWTTPGK